MRRIVELIDGVRSGAVGPDELAARLATIVRERPERAAELYTLAKQWRDEGRLPAEAFGAIEAALHAVKADEQDDGTRLKPPAVTAPPGAAAATPIGSYAPSEPGTGTRLRAPARTEPPIDTSGRSAMPEPSPSPARIRAERRLEPGVVVKDRFLLLEQIGKGGMGVVFKARDQEYKGHEQYVALKFLSGDLEGRPEALRALEQEVRKTHELAHPNIVTVFDFYRDDPFCFISMEFLDGEPLDRLLRRASPRGMPFANAWPIIEAAGTALDYAHEKGIIHSDFKPGNVFLARGERIKVLDFGIARAARVESDEFDVSVLGGLTPAYASPEMILNLEPDPRDDVYALACVAYELLSGRHPFDRTPAHRAQHAGMVVAKIPGLSRARMRALEKGLAFTRDARTLSIRDFLTELEAVPKRDRIYRIARLAALGMLGVVGVGTYVYSSSQRCDNLDAAFLQSLRPAAPAETIDPSYRDVLIEQGEEYLALAAADFDPALLSEGVSDAFGAFRSVLRIDPNDVVAAAGILRMIGLYEAEAERLLERGEAEESARVADYGLQVHPQHCGLNRIRERAAALLD